MGTWAVPGGSTVQHVITTSPAGLSLTVDGGGCTSPCTFNWTPGTSHTIATTLKQLPYYFSYWNDSGALSHAITAQSSPTTYTANFFNDPLEALKKCLDPLISTSATCTLAAGTHTVNSTIEVKRSNVTITGEDRSTTALVRGASHTSELMLVNVAPPAQSITIQNLTFCGNSALSTPASPCPSPPPPSAPTTCGAWQRDIHEARRRGDPDPDGTYICTDLYVANADTRQRPMDPFAYIGPYSVTISNCAFEGSTGHAIALYPTAPQEVNDVYITGTAINSSEVTGLLVGVNGENYSDSRACDSNPNFKDDTSVHAPRNIRVEGSNTFANNLTGAMGINAARWFALRNNTFTNNYIMPQAGNEAGGSVFFDQCTDKIQIYRNTLTGPTYLATDGLELWGRNIDVGADDPAQRNTVSNYQSEGIAANSVFNATITNNTTSNNGAAYPTGGILVWTREPGGPCDPVFRDTQNVTVTGNTSTGQTYGVYLGEREASTNIVNTITIGTSGPVFRDAYVTLTGAASGVPAPEPPQAEQLAPRALPVNPIQDLAAPIRPLPSKCSETGNRREVVSFPATDVHVENGAGNIFWIQGMFSVAGDDNTGSGGPDSGAQGCHFIFYPPEDTSTCTPSSGCGVLYLDKDGGGFDWTPESPSVVGPGGHDLANSYCRIRAASTDSRVTFEGKVLKLNLDIEFLSSTKRHMYTATGNRQGLTNASDGSSYWPWRYSGWWKWTQ
ncbi:MAG: hypothetical protein HYS04_19900 [Acidobacteria bacterium]|nr:hypothetical protein [Acidobacteriota bacterium]